MSRLAGFLFVILISSDTAPATELDLQTREAISRSIPAIESKGQSWIDKKDCVSCHRVNTMVWSLGAARRVEIVGEHDIEETLQWSLDRSLEVNDEGKLALSGNMEGVAQLLLAQKMYFPDQDSEAVQRAFQKSLKEGVTKDGVWPAGGQLPSQKREKAETSAVSSYWLAFTAHELLSGDTRSSALESFDLDVPEELGAESTEWYAVRLLLANALQEESRADRLRTALIELQREDGGWGWLVDGDSDALGTGLVIYGLLKSGVPADHAAITAGRKFLLDSQREDGTWDVRGTKSKKQHRTEETAVYWGTTWAVIALAECLSVDEGS